MVLYRREWEWVASRILRMKEPTIEMQTLHFRISRGLAVTTEDPMAMLITDGQTDWIADRCRLITIHKRPPKAP